MDCEQRDAGRKKLHRLRRLHRTLFFARQLQVPDWLLQVPEDLTDDWLLLVRPAGDRCLLLSDSGRVEVRRKNGYVLERFQDSRLPSGLTVLDVVCMESPSEPEKHCMQDTGKSKAESDNMACSEEAVVAVEKSELCDINADDDMGVQHKASGRKMNGKGHNKGSGKGRPGRPKGEKKYAVCDVLVWGDVDMACAEADCRMFWLQSRFAEMSDKHSRRARPLQLIPASLATPEALIHAYNTDVGYEKDSFLLLHREGHYGISEAVTPLALSWRDRHISRFVVDTPDGKGEVLPEQQAVVLEVRKGGHLRTADHKVVAQLSEQQLAQARDLAQGQGPKVGSLLRCKVQSVDVATQRLGGVEVVAHVAARSRVWADSWGRIVFQHLHREGQAAQISFQALLQAVGHGAAA